MDRQLVFGAINVERERQSGLWAEPGRWGRGDCSSAEVADIVKAAVLSEEAGEVARAVLDGSPRDLRRELVQVAAVAVAWLEGFP